MKRSGSDRDNERFIIEERQTTTLVIGLLFTNFFCFTLGYFAGRQRAYSEQGEIKNFEQTDRVLHDVMLEKHSGNKLFRIHLADFCRLGDAQDLVSRLQKNGIATTIIQHKGLGCVSQGAFKSVPWYQVATEAVCHEKLTILLHAVDQTIKLSSPRIVKVHDGVTSRKITQK